MPTGLKVNSTVDAPLGVYPVDSSEELEIGRRGFAREKVIGELKGGRDFPMGNVIIPREA
ncbi:hypothetical protein DESUT3_33220 [Desulfuromonas versatilis]|uniref:Uncharacterized protein n=1 Tax=Desulfuromonas versatilis TaxID=2802975 RepID=A0ABM8I099_9BACT|nr:hypothetical protein DESUT3_33220 [Desulfuromonas versatilis]